MIFASHQDDAVLVGGWVPDVLFPAARPPHVGSVDVDIAIKLGRSSHLEFVELLVSKGFHPGRNGYQFFKEVVVDGQRVVARLDLLTSIQHHEEQFAGGDPSPMPVHGADIAFRNNAIASLDSTGGLQIRVAGIVAFLVMKCLALSERHKPKDAYDLHFCLENYPAGLDALADEFKSHANDPLVREATDKLRLKFRSEEDEGPRMVADVEGVIGEARSIRKLGAYTRVSEFLARLPAA